MDLRKVKKNGREKKVTYHYCATQTQMLARFVFFFFLRDFFFFSLAASPCQKDLARDEMSPSP